MGGHQPEITVQPPGLGQKARRLGCLLRYLAGAGRMRRDGQRQAAEAHALCARWRGEQLETIGADELVRRMSALQRHARDQTGLMFIQISTGSLSMLLDLVERTLPGESHALVAGLMAGGEPSVTAQQGYDLLALAATAAGDPVAADWLRDAKSSDWQNLPEDNAFRREFADFIERYGHRGVYESYLRTPRWREDAGYLLRRIADLMGSDPLALRARQQELRASAHTRLARHFPFWTRKWAAALAKTANRECNDRESGRSAFTAYIEAARHLLLEAGRRLAARGDLRSAQQVFHLIPSEVVAALAGELVGSALHHLVFDRERQCADWQANPAPEVILAGDATLLAGPASAVPKRDGACWHGVAVGAGIASGPARCIRDPDQGGRLAPGDILVAPSTDPAWTPLFLKAGGLVMETGGYLSHGAIVAREFGIPAVANLPGILDTLADGAPLEVDGQRGTVRQIS
jgi:phosphohistidine swiveling domain-containing protein